MSVSKHIDDLITLYKSKPNGEIRNKVLSHLKDAKYAAMALEHYENKAPHPADQCTCPLGAVDEECPLHG